MSERRDMLVASYGSDAGNKIADLEEKYERRYAPAFKGALVERDEVVAALASAEEERDQIAAYLEAVNQRMLSAEERVEKLEAAIRDFWVYIEGAPIEDFRTLLQDKPIGEES